MPVRCSAREPPGRTRGGGWHWAEWGCELVGAAFSLFGGLSGLFLDFAPGSPVARVLPGQSWRLLVTGLIFAAVGLIVTASRWAPAPAPTSIRR
ncbi:MAG TPA: hypothetical protein VF070_00815 [Streptosporangiaceae bacterium]